VSNEKQVSYDRRLRSITNNGRQVTKRLGDRISSRRDHGVDILFPDGRRVEASAAAKGLMADAGLNDDIELAIQNNASDHNHTLFIPVAGVVNSGESVRAG